MPRYKVISSSNKVINVCNLMVIDEEGRVQSINVKELTGEGGKIFIDKEIDVVTTNREIIPSEEPAVMQAILPGLVPRMVLDVKELFAVHGVIPQPEWIEDRMDPETVRLDPFLSNPFSHEGGITWVCVVLTEEGFEDLRLRAA